MRKSFAETKERFGRIKYLSKARKDEIQPTPAPATPVSDTYIITMRPKDAAPKRREMLEDLVVQEEQRKREDWLRAEEVRAAVLPHQLQAEVERAIWIESINKMLQERNKAIQEARARDEEAAKYGYSSYEALQQAIREEKAIRRANELGLSLTEAQQIAQAVAREGYQGAATRYGQDPQAMIAELTAQAEAAQRSLRENFGIEIKTTVDGQPIQPGDYLRDLSQFAAEQRQISASIQQTARRSGIVDQDTGLRIVSAGPPLKASDYPAPPAAAATTEPSPLGAFTREHMLPWTPAHEFFSKGLFEAATLLAGPALIASKPAGRIIKADIHGAGADLFTAYVKGEYTGLREDPEVAIASLAIGAAIPGIGKGASFLGRAASSRIGVPEAVKQAIPKISKTLGAGLLGAYGGSVAVRAGAPDEAGAFPSATLVSERLGRITSTEIAPAFIGGYGAQRGLDITIDYARTRGLPELDATALIPESVRTGRTQFPVEPPGRTPPEALAARFRRAGEPLGFHGTRAEGGFHATDAPFPPRATITLGRRPYEGGGLSIAPQISPHFLRVGSSYSAFGLDLFPASSRPTVMFMRPEAGVRVIPPDVPRSSMAPMAEFMLSPRAQRGAAYIAPKYEAGWRRAAMESEAMIPVGTITESVGPIGYVRWAGRRVPVEERIALSDAGTLRISPADITTAIPGISSSVLPKSSPVTSPATFAGIGGIPSSSRFEVSAPAVSITPSISTPRPARPSAPSHPSRPSQSVPIVPSVSIPDIIPSVPRSSPPRSPPPSSIYDIPKPPSSSYTPSPPPSSQITLSPPPSSQITPYRPPSSQITPYRPPSSQITLSPPPSSRPPFTPGLSEDQRRASFGDEFYLHAADLPTPHARLEEAYTNLRDPKIRPAKIIRNLERITIGSPPRTPRRARTVQIATVRKTPHRVPWDIPAVRTPRRARTVQIATVRKTPHRVPWDIPAVRPLDVVGVPDLVFDQKKKKKSRRRR
jgi:hypothetical protein